MRLSTSVFALIILTLAVPVRADDCGRPWPSRKAEIARLLATPPVTTAFQPDRPLPLEARFALKQQGVREDNEGVRLPLRSGAAAMMANDWSQCPRGEAGCEPSERFELRDHLDDVGFYLVAGWLPKGEGVLWRLVDDRTGATTRIGGRPHPSPSRRRAVVVAGDSRLVWSGTEIWRLKDDLPTTEWEQDALAPADYAFVGWHDEDTVLLAVRGLSFDQMEPLTAVLACGAKTWHLIHDVRRSWLLHHASPSGNLHALARTRGVVIWRNGEQIFSAPADVIGFQGWDGEGVARFDKIGGGTLRVVRGPSGWAMEEPPEPPRSPPVAGAPPPPPAGSKTQPEKDSGSFLKWLLPEW